ncbi:MAG: cell division protein FtsA [Bacteroidales bacterium]|nr:cell division protein FtsA [Bacteroidales bacterium]MBQ6871124.1 cell division protein FtsA [Bacteroidales bacterium]MBQ7997881.1 cell division protein FtsA [Bacteroidales bacterium]MBQ8034203.1 cell division protein FtsA [Bacteroidales bacterium]MBR4095149.1 cell division protein FtsA [Bacteroidales bacterium]
MRHLIAAIDLGTTKVVCAVGEKTPAGIKIIAHSQAPSKGVLRGEVINIQHVLDSMLPVVNEVENAIGHKINEVFVGIAGQNIRCATNASQTTRRQPEELITQEEIDTITSDMYGTFVQNGEKVLHVIPQSYNIDDFMGITEPVGMIGQQINANFKLFIGKSNSAQFSNNVISRAGLKLRELVLEPLASAKAVLSEDECEVGVAMLDIGGGTSDLLIIQDNIIRHAAVIPFGGNSVTEDIRMGCGISSKHAEQLKVQYGSCFSASAPKNTIVIPGIGGRESREISFKVLANIIEARMAEIFEAVDFEIEKSGYKNLLQAGLVITGGSAQMLNICQLASTVTGLEARVAYPDESIVSDSISEVYSPAQATAVGLVLKGFEKMAREKTVYNTATPIKYDIFADSQQEEELATVEVAENEKKEKESEKVQKVSFWERLKGSLNTDKMFNPDNQA